MSNTWEKGLSGEAIARKYLENKGFKTLATNWRYGNHLEIDIVCLSPSNELIGVEVRTHLSTQNYKPFESIDYKKIKRIAKALEIFLSKSNLPQDTHCQVDVVSIVKNDNEIEHFESVDLDL